MNESCDGASGMVQPKIPGYVRRVTDSRMRSRRERAIERPHAGLSDGTAYKFKSRFEVYVAEILGVKIGNK